MLRNTSPLRHFAFLLLLLSLFACGSQQSGMKEQQDEQQNLVEKKSIVQDLMDHQHLSIEERIARYYHLKSTEFENYNFDMEDKLNLHGYDLLWAGKTEEALAIFQLVVDEFPESANAYDSLGEAHLALGNMDLALENYEKTLALNPNNFFAEDQIERIKFPNKKQLTAEEKFALVLPKEEYFADLDQLSQDLKTMHPFVFKFITEADFDALVLDGKNQIDEDYTVGEFLWLCHKIVAAVNCSHTSVGEFWEARNMMPDPLRFPLQVQYIDEKLYVVDNRKNEDKVNIGDEILSINQSPVQDVMSNIYTHLVSQGEIKTTKTRTFNAWANVLLPYALNFPNSYSIITKNSGNKAIALRPNSKTKEIFDNPGIQHCDDELCFSLYEEQATAFMRIASFNYYDWNRFGEFKEFMDENFKVLRDKNIQKLIIDLRGNGGGAPEASIHLLRYLMDQEFEYFGEDSGYQLAAGVQRPFPGAFKGEVMYLIDGGGQSTTGHFMAMVKHYELGTILGEELGSNHFCTGGQQRCRSKNTKIEYAIAMGASFLQIETENDHMGVLPDVEIHQSIDDYLARRDVVKERAFELAGVPKSAWYVAPITGLLSSSSDWGEELFRLPISFAPELSYQGFEELRFAPHWSDPAHENFWTYLFVWCFEPQVVIEKQLNADIEHYFDGLMNIERRTDEGKNHRTRSNLKKVQGGFRGEVELFDGFYTKLPIRFYVDVKANFCDHREMQLLRFEISPKNFDHPLREGFEKFTYLAPCSN